MPDFDSFNLTFSAPEKRRREHDQYFTPQPLADALVREYLLNNPPPSRVLEPSVGMGAWARACNRTVFDIVEGVDIIPRSESEHCCSQFTCCDFLSFRPTIAPSLIIGNPPYSEAESHVRHALDIVARDGRVAFLLRLAFCESAGRIAFWRAHPAESIHVLAERPSFTGGGTDNAAYGFFVWRKTPSGQPAKCFPGFSWRH